MGSLEILRSLLREKRESEDGRLPLGELRFILEYRDAPEIEQERAKVGALLGGDRDFVLRTLFPKPLDRFLVLRFPGLSNQVDRRSLFETAYGIRRDLDLISVEPDLDSSLFVDPEPPSRRQIESTDLLTPFCWVNKPAPPEHRWALATTRILDAWAISPSKGHGVLIGQPDTGVARHSELDTDALDLQLAWDVLDGDSDVTDPWIRTLLIQGMAPLLRVW